MGERKIQPKKITAELIIKNDDYADGKGGNLKIDKIKFDLQNLDMFKIDGNSEVNESVTIAPGESKTYTVKLKKNGITWKKPKTSEEQLGYINATIEGAKKSGAFTEKKSVTVKYWNEDVSQKEEAEKEAEEISFKYNEKKLQEELNNYTLGWDTLGFQMAGIGEKEKSSVEYCAKIWVSQIFSTIAIVEKDTYFEKIGEKLKDKAKDKYKELVLEALGVASKDVSVYLRTDINQKNATANTIIEVTDSQNKKYQVHLSLNITSYSINKDNAFSGYGTIYYYITDTNGKRIDGSIGQTGRLGTLITYTNLMQFGKSVEGVAKESVKLIYDNSISKAMDNKIDFFRKQLRANNPDCKLVKMLTSDITNKLIKEKYGSFSKNVFKISAKQVEKFYKTTAVKCPVDVYVYNSANELCGTVINNEATVYSEEVYIEVVGDEKYASFADDDYRLELVGNDSGTMTYEVMT